MPINTLAAHCWRWRMEHINGFCCCLASPATLEHLQDWLRLSTNARLPHLRLVSFRLWVDNLRIIWMEIDFVQLALEQFPRLTEAQRNCPSVASLSCASPAEIWLPAEVLDRRLLRATVKQYAVEAQQSTPATAPCLVHLLAGVDNLRTRWMEIDILQHWSSFHGCLRLNGTTHVFGIVSLSIKQNTTSSPTAVTRMLMEVRHLSCNILTLRNSTFITIFDSVHGVSAFHHTCLCVNVVCHWLNKLGLLSNDEEQPVA